MMKTDLIAYIRLSNPWLINPEQPIFAVSNYIQRVQFEQLIKPIWDDYITILTGPRQAGKTTLGRFLCQQLVNQARFTTTLYLNCDEFLVREWLTGSHVLQDIQQFLGMQQFVLFIDEVQRLQSPGLLLKSIYDLKLPIKMIATGSSQLEIKSKVQEHLTGRHLESVILPLSYEELGNRFDINVHPVYGCYPNVVIETEKQLILTALYQNYINKDIIEILKIRNADTMQLLLMLIAHSSGQMVNYQQLATDCRISSLTVQHYLSILESTYILCAVKPFVGNKRAEITSNPIYYFIDNGFRNQALNNFSPLSNRTDIGLLIQSAIFQELYKFKIQNYLNVAIHYWRTKGGAEVDFVLYKNAEIFVPIEIKYRNLVNLSVSRGFRSFVQAYQPKLGIIITKDLYGELMVDNSHIFFIPFSNVQKCLEILKKRLQE
jgi:predicted AAA+ superfamily ATPase